MQTPISTYRVQLHRDFNLRHLKEILPYLHALGITTVYASPVFEAVPGSTHGYDVLNPHRINPELGTEADLLEISQWLRAHNMTWLQDIVPNHMAYRSTNPWIYDVLEKGSFSRYYTSFDIIWQHSFYPNQLMVPLLDQSLEEALAAGNLNLHFGERGFYYQFYEHAFPVDFRQYASLLENLPLPGDANAQWDQLLETARQFARLAPGSALNDQVWTQFKADLYTFVQNDETTRQAVTALTDKYQNDPEKAQAFITQQNFRMVHWQDTDKVINYRRFFTVNDLICLRMESEQTFTHYHQYIKSLFDRGVIQSLRIDHVDGLYNPKEYVKRLRQLVGEDTYIIVEKILEPNEYMPTDWDVQGTTGYDFLSLVNRLLISDKSTDSFSDFYSQIHVLAYDFEEAVFRKKLFMLIHHMGGELDNLTDQLIYFFPDYTITDERRINYRQVLAYWLVSFPVYRLYLDENTLSDTNAKALGTIFEEACRKAPDTLSVAFEEVRPLLSPEPDQVNEQTLRFLMRTQQFTGPLMAKGVEDTAFYVYNRLISRNEVGDTPHTEENINVFRFHSEMRKRALTTMNATATHDTKRGEDARMRINVLSELPDEWQAKVKEWQEIAQPYYWQEGGKTIPDPNDEYFIYQTLIGTYSLHTDPVSENYADRLKDYLNKVMKEAKVHTSWTKPDEVYEANVAEFTSKLLNDNAFMTSFVPFAQKVSWYGAVYSWIQTLIRLTAPGVPDTYRGTEFWDLSMVDPDNRRPVNYIKRQQVLETVVSGFSAPALLQQALADPLQPELKLFVLQRLLHTRRQNPGLFLQGSYRAVVTAGRYARQVLAFTRQHNDEKVLIIFPLEIASLATAQTMPIGQTVWDDTCIGWEEGNGETYMNIFTQEVLALSARQPVGDLLAHFPIGCWLKQPSTAQ